jgi:pimeloyl-ACP methyl ester carboxylesterase
VTTTRTARTDDGVDVAWYPIGADEVNDASRPPLLLAHATGFHGRAFAPLAGALSASYACVAFDERGHGDTPTPDDGSFDWQGFGRDALAVVDNAELDRPFGVGHSAGGAASLLAEIARPGTFRALYCYEPIVAPIDQPPPGREPGMPNPLAVAARKRRDVFPSKQAAYDNYASKPPMGTFHPDALRAYVDHGFEELDDGTVRLKCRPESEARTYEMGYRHGAFAGMPAVRCPVTIAWGSATTTLGPEVFNAHVARLPAGRAEPLDGLGHFGPFEDPARLARSVLTAFAAVAGA